MPDPAVADAPATGYLAKLPTFTPPPKEQFAVVNARAAFDPARQPIVESSSATAASATAPPAVTLVGVVLGGSNAVALLLRANGQTISVRTGQSVDGWQVVRIAPPGLAVFRAGATDYTVTLRAAAGLAQPPLNDSSPPPSTEKPGQ
jgi:hypothetical protein